MEKVGKKKTGCGEMVGVGERGRLLQEKSFQETREEGGTGREVYMYKGPARLLQSSGAVCES